MFNLFVSGFIFKFKLMIMIMEFQARDLRTLDSMTAFGVINIEVGYTATPNPSTVSTTGSTPGMNAMNTISHSFITQL